MRTTAKILTGLISVVLGLSGAFSLGDQWSTGNGTSPGGGRPGDASGYDSDEARRLCDGLLERARQAISEKDLQTAESLLSQAEALGVTYGPFHRGDSPAKVRRELEGKLAAGGSSTSLPGRLLSTLSGASKAGSVTDPFAARAGATPSDAKSLAKSHIRQGRGELRQGNLAAAAHWYRQAAGQKATFGRNEDSPAKLAADIVRAGGRLDATTTTANVAAGRGNVTPLPPTDPSVSFKGLGSSRAPATSSLASGRTRSDGLLLAARRALAEGDVSRARELARQARTLNVSYGPRDDSPARVEATIRSYSDLAAEKNQRGNTEAYRSQYARVLMEQAEGLLRYRDYDRAEQLAGLAGRQGIAFGPYQPNPTDLLNRIASARRQERTGGIGSQPGRLSPRAATSLASAKPQAAALVRRARAAMAAGDLRKAEDLARQAERLQVPHAAFGLNEDRPDLVLIDVGRARMRAGSYGRPGEDGRVVPATGASGIDRRVSHALYDQRNDSTWNMPAGAQQPTPAAPRPAGRPGASLAGREMGQSLFQQGEAALTAHDTARAMDYFRRAADYKDQLDPVTAQRLQDRLHLLPGAGGRSAAPSMLDEAALAQQRLVQQVAMDLMRQQSQANAMRETDPHGALAQLEQARQIVEAAGLEPTARDRLLARVDRGLVEMRDYIEQNRSRIDLEDQNQRTLEQIEREQQMKIDVENRLVELFAEYNRLMEEARFAEAEVVAKRAAELDPQNPQTVQLLTVAKMVRRHLSNLALRDEKEQGFWQALDDVERSAIPFPDDEPYVLPEAREWEALTRRRSQWLGDQNRRRSEHDLAIEQKLNTPVRLQFNNAPLSEVVDYLSEIAAVNMHLDQQGLGEEGVASNDPVTINLREDISLRSALNLILEPMGLSYVIKDQVLKITSEQYVDGEVFVETYNVADLVMPIPNFTPSAMGLDRAYSNAVGRVGFGWHGAFGGGASPLAVVASRDGGKNMADVSPSVLAQMPTGQGSPMTTNMPAGFGGPGGLGGGTMADFDTLIELIKTTVAPDSWDDVGGPGAVSEFPTNLSIVVSQTQDVHEEISDLLAQLRRMQDLQVTIEVRFITLNDNFFERIGIDFDFDIDDDIDRPFQVFGKQVDDGDPATGDEPVRNTLDTDHDNGAVTVGLQAPNLFSADLDIPFRQDHFLLAVPQFGGFDATAGAQLGFAILSDIEAFFFISAAQGDRRSNVLQAPKVTLFNGQMAFVSDTSQSPFVISVIPVVGDFAAATQPVIVVLSEGTFLTVQAVVSNDRRFVRLTLVPFFSRIGEVNTFKFEGSETTTATENTSQQGNQEDPNDATQSSNSRDATVTRSGTTVQLPTFSFISVTTTVSVPDGGTVLLGGIKRLSEGRNEFGVPMLNKLPYINRLFRNVGIGREAQSLMMMVTPRIIIQEEEEQRLGIL